MFSKRGQFPLIHDITFNICSFEWEDSYFFLKFLRLHPTLAEWVLSLSNIGIKKAAVLPEPDEIIKKK